MFRKITFITLTISLFLLIGGCKLAPYDAATVQHLENLKQAHITVIDTCATMQVLDAGGFDNKQTVWQDIYRGAMNHQNGLLDNDDMRKNAFRTIKDHYDKNIKDLETARYPLSPAFVNNIKEQVYNDYDAAINGERARKGSPVNP
ncbi:MAG: hypothetical protein KJ620_08575 [Candidatus Edwardsbacteria bacterium]|nr:hypothetical protein [Candidatus Edwardsbacteria bacterium]MBU1576774.1 hypothetical protein [Candidatus Edwardsbacteria bacterium]MBU2464587.1 hypothetical protein [Candidatus Edwardsbacteria bacterium]MBU2593369.1 hypothetical protein [Candidatus Edwardsbacteria bacterium]